MTASRKARVHPADVANLAAIGRATSFRTHFRKGPHEVWESTQASLALARAERDRINAEHGQFGRRCAIYAMIPGRAAILVPDSYQEAGNG